MIKIDYARSISHLSDAQLLCVAEPAMKWKPSIHMPRAHSRLTLTIRAVKIERLQDIDEQQCEQEGLQWRDGLWNCPSPDGQGYWHSVPTAKRCFKILWNKLHGDGAWDENPEVVAMSFNVAARNIDEETHGLLRA